MATDADLHGPLIRRVVGAMLHRLPASVERVDLVQAAMIRVWLYTRAHGAPSDAQVHQMSRWAVKDTLRETDHLTRWHRREVKAGRLCNHAIVAMDEALTVAAEVDVQAEAEARELVRKLEAALADLPAGERAAVLADAGELSALAREMGIPWRRLAKLREKGISSLRLAFGIAPKRAQVKRPPSRGQQMENERLAAIRAAFAAGALEAA